MENDTISRQAAINALENTECELLPEEWNELTDAIMNVPSAQPEIIRCKDCRYSEYDALYDDRYCHYDGKADIVPDEHYCGYAERKEDE